MVLKMLREHCLPIFIAVMTVVVVLWYRMSETVEHFEDEILPSKPSEHIHRALTILSNKVLSAVSDTEKIDQTLVDAATNSRKDLGTVMTSDKINPASNTSIKSNVVSGRLSIDGLIPLAQISPSAWDVYNVTASKIVNDPQYGANALKADIQTQVNDYLRNITVDISVGTKQAIYYATLNAYRKYMNNKDINNALTSSNPLVQNPAQLNDYIQQTIKNATNTMIKASIVPPKVKLGDFVFFQHVIDVSPRSPDICADNTSTTTLIVGGKICSMNLTDQTARLQYSFIMNPSKNDRCTQQRSSVGSISYDSAATYPVWYMPCNDADANCCTVPTNFTPSDGYRNYTFACEKVKVSESVANNPNNSIKTYIGGHESYNNGYVQYSCGISPTGYNLPTDVSFLRLYKTIQECLESSGGSQKAPNSNT